MAPAPKKKQSNTKSDAVARDRIADTVAPERLVVMRPLVFNRTASAPPDPKLAQKRAQMQASTQALADAFSGCSLDDGSGIDMAAVGKAIKGGANINTAVNGLGQTALHVAVNENNHALAAQLLRAGANTRARDHAGLTPLILSLREGDEAMSGMLARAEEKPEAQVLNGRHAIHDAAARNHVEAIEALIARGLSPTIKDVDGDSPLMEALKNEKCAAIFALAYAGGVQAGMERKYKEALSDTGGFDRPDYNLDRFLKQALDAGPQALKPQPVVLPQKLGASDEELFDQIATRNVDAWTPLLKKRPDLNARNAAGDTPLIAALRRGVWSAADKLVEKSDPNAAGAFGQTALHHLASSTGRGEWIMARRLIELGAKLNLQDLRGQTPLMMAVNAGSKDMIDLLLTNGAKPDIRDKLGFSAADHAEFTRNSDVIDLMEQAADKKDHTRAKSAKTAFKPAAVKQPAKTAAKAPAKKPAAKKPAAKKQLAKQAGRRYR